jgi:hypothetical protein
MFVRGANPIWFMADLTGAPLDDRYFAFFLTNTLPFVPQPVYQDPNGISLWVNPLEFQPSSGLPTNLYFDPSLVYRIEIRKGNTQSDPLIWLIENYVPGEGGNIITPSSLIGLENIIINPQFADTFFPTSATFTAAGTYSIAPGWDLVIVGPSGSTTVTQIAFPANSDLPGNPPYALRIASTGSWSSVKLRQTIVGNGAIFSGGGIAISLMANAFTAPETISFTYSPSGPTNPTTSENFNVEVNSYLVYAQILAIPGSINTNTGDNAFVNLDINLPELGDISLTNIQVVGQSTPIPVNSPLPSFQETTPEEQLNAEFNVYQPSLLMQPKKSLLAGWNFGLNPWQFTNPALTTVVANQYTADQTIIIQQNLVAHAVGSNVDVGQDTAAHNYGLLITPATSTNQFGILQWIDASTIRPYWGKKLSSMVNAFITLGAGSSSNVKLKMRLIYSSSVPGATGNNTPIATWPDNGDPTEAAGFTLIKPINDPLHPLTQSSSSYSFNQFQLPVADSANMTLGILLYTDSNMTSGAVPDEITINDVSLVDNDFAIATEADTFDETLRKCQFYYEKSLPPGYYFTPGGAAPTPLGQIEEFRTIPIDYTVRSPRYVSALFLYDFVLNFITTKRIIPNVSFYNYNSGTLNNVLIGIEQNKTFPTAGGSGGTLPASPNPNPTEYAIGSWTINSASVDRIVYQSNSTNVVQIYLPDDSFSMVPHSSLGDMAGLYYHYSADARIG